MPFAGVTQPAGLHVPPAPLFGPLSTEKVIVAPGTGWLFELCANAVTVWFVPTGLVAEFGDKPTVEKRIGSGFTNATGDSMSSANAVIPVMLLSQHDHPIVGLVF